MSQAEDQKEARQLLANAEAAARRGQYIAASAFVGAAIQLHIKLGGGGELRQLKEKQIEYNKLSEKEYMRVSHTERVSIEEIDRIIATFTAERSVRKNLLNIGRDRFFLPDYARVLAIATKTRPASLQLFSHAVVDAAGNTISVDDAENYWAYQVYSFQQGLTSTLLSNVFAVLAARPNFTSAALMRFFKTSGLFDADELSKMDVALKAFLNKDYVSALHVLVPTFESFFMKISLGLGLDVISLGRGKPTTSRRVLSEKLLDSTEFKDQWGQDFCFLIKYILLHEYGHKIRHKIAHGEIKSDECTHQACVQVLFLFIKVASMIVGSRERSPNSLK